MEPEKLTLNSLEVEEQFAAVQELETRASTNEARAFAESLITGVCEQRETLDALISAMPEHWRPERVARTEWVILQIALYEIICNTPTPVVISEAMRLATVFGSDESPRFISGILNRFVDQKRGAGDVLSVSDFDVRHADDLG